MVAHPSHNSHSKKKFFSLPTLPKSKSLLLPVMAVLGVVVLGASTFLSYRYFQAKEAQSAANLTIRDDIPSDADVTPATASESAVILNSPTASAAAIHVPILMYHYIEHVTDLKDTFRQKLDILPETLDSQLKTLQDDGYTFMYMSDLADVIDGKKQLPPKPVILTFDDGYRDFYTDAFPVLKKYQAKSTAYIITGFIGKPNFMFLPQLQEVEQSGIVEIGAHTEHHIDLNHASEKKQTEEIVGSREALQKLFPDAGIFSFAYPSGRYNDQTIQIVKDAGFTTAVSTNPGTAVTAENRLVLFRLRPGSRTGKTLLQFLKKMTS